MNIKTRIVEKRQGEITKFIPQYECEFSPIFGKTYKEWVNISVDTIAGRVDVESDRIEEAKRLTDEFLFANGCFEEIIHWYPEKAK